MPADSPHLVVLAGPNGAGKSTAAPWVLREMMGIREFVNADLIAQGLSPFNPEQAAMAAGRIMLERLKELAAQWTTFAFETTLAGRVYAPWIQSLTQKGYLFDLIYFWLPSADTAVDRVANRVRMGGHDIPLQTIRRRYERGLINFFQLYQPLASQWRFYDSGDDQIETRLIASGRFSDVSTVADTEIWDKLLQRYSHASYGKDH